MGQSPLHANSGVSGSRANRVSDVVRSRSRVLLILRDLQGRAQRVHFPRPFNLHIHSLAGGRSHSRLRVPLQLDKDGLIGGRTRLVDEFGGFFHLPSERELGISFLITRNYFADIIGTYSRLFLFSG